MRKSPQKDKYDAEYTQKVLFCQECSDRLGASTHTPHVLVVEGYWEHYYCEVPGCSGHHAYAVK